MMAPDIGPAQNTHWFSQWAAHTQPGQLVYMKDKAAALQFGTH